MFRNFFSLAVTGILALVLSGCAEKEPQLDWSKNENSKSKVNKDRPVESDKNEAIAVDSKLAQLAAEYRVDIVDKNIGFPIRIPAGSITGKPADAADLESYGPILIEEFGKYPVELILKTRLKRIVLCAELAYEGQKRNAVPDFANNTLFLDVATAKSNQRYLRKVIHHEYFHMIDYADDGSVYSDKIWAALNSDEFKYTVTVERQFRMTQERVC